MLLSSGHGHGHGLGHGMVGAMGPIVDPPGHPLGISPLPPVGGGLVSSASSVSSSVSNSSNSKDKHVEMKVEPAGSA